MHRFRSWTLDPPEWRTQRNRALSLEGGDGSSLNVDFTTGVLDPKLSHSRGSNATFINSSGLVEWANSNMALRSDIMQTTVDGVSDGTQWNPGVGYTVSLVSTTRPDGSTGNVRRLQNTTGAGSFFNAAPISVIPGQRYTFSFWARNNGGSQARIRVWNNTASSSIIDHTQPQNNYIDDIGGAGNTSTTWVRIFRTFVIPAGCNAISIYPSSHDSGTVDLYVFGAQLNYGSIPGTYLSTTNTVNGNTPRFDYNPTTLESNGLLIEGNVSNLITYSDASTTGWTGINVTGSNNNATSPDGTTSATLWTGSGGSNNRAYSATFNVTSGSTYTVSAWFKKPASNGSRYVKIYLLSFTEGAIGWPSDGVLDLNTGTASGTGFTVTAYKDNWYRVVSTGTVTSTTSARAFIAMCTSTGALLTTTESMLAWGCQVEAGSGASSYIPTGSSSVTRVNDSVTFNDRNWFTSWKSTWFANYKVFNCAGLPTLFYARSSQDAFNNHLNIVVNNTNSLTSVLSRSTSNAAQQWSTNNPLLSITSEFNKCAWVIDDTAKIAHAGVIDYTSTSGRSLPLGSGLSAYEIALNPTVGTSCSMWLRSLKYYPKALNNVELINLTKPTIPNEALSLVFDNTNYDSRIVFDRGTNATFVNSLGLVQWADANMQPNTAFTGITSFAVPGGWGGFVGPDPGGGGTRANFTLISPGTVKCTAGSILATNTCRCFLSTVFSYSLGIPLTIKATVVDKQWSSANLTEFLLWTNSTTSEVTYYKNGVSIGDISVAQGYTDWTSGDEITLIVVPTAINGTVRVGLGNNNNQPVNSYITFNKFIVLPGRQPQTLSNYYTHSNTGSGYFAPRLDYDPTNTGTLKGLLVENASTNFIQYSSDFTQASTWIPAGTGLIQTNNTTETTAPDGSNTASILARGTSGIYIESTLGTLAANTQVTLSCWLKKRGTNSIGSLAIGTGSAWVASGASLEFNFDNPASSTLINPGNVIRWGYTQYPNNWYRIYMVITTSATPAGAKIRFRVDSPIGADGYYLWGPQVEENRIMTSYIPTGSALSTIRNAESYYIPTSSWFTNNPYSMDFKYEMNDPSGLFIGRYCGAFSLGGGNPRLFIATNYQGASAAADDGRRAQLFDSGTLNLTPGSYPVTAASNTKLVFGVQSSLTSFMSTTSLINTSTSAALLTGFDRLWIGREATSNRAINGWMKHIKYWSTRLGNNQLKYLSGS